MNDKLHAHEHSSQSNLRNQKHIFGHGFNPDPSGAANPTLASKESILGCCDTYPSDEGLPGVALVDFGSDLHVEVEKIYIHEHFLLASVHRLDNKVLVKGAEHEGATFTC